MIVANVQSGSERVVSTACYVEIPPVEGRESSRALQHGVASALDRGERRIVVDCASWSEMDLKVLSTLVGCARKCDREGAKLDLANLRSEMRTMIDSLHLSGRLGLVD